MSLCRNNWMDMYLMLYLLENHAYFDLVDIFYRNFTQSTTKRRSCHFCAHTNKSRCRVGKWPLYRHILKIFFRTCTCSYKIISGVFRNHIHLLLLILPSTKYCQYNLQHAVCERLYPQQSAIDDSEEVFPSITVTVRQHINLLTCSS